MSSISSPATDSISLSIILYLQQHTYFTTPALFLTQLGDPALIFFYLAPAVYWLTSGWRSVSTSAASSSGLSSTPSPPLTLILFLTLLLTDWLNALLKWPFRGDRPYWYDPRVLEFHVTCESGYGMPSGHCMVASCLAMVVVLTARKENWKRRYQLTLQICLSIFIILLALTRMYVGAHFIEQVLAGIVFGCGTGYAIMRLQLGERLLKRLAPPANLRSNAAGGGRLHLPAFFSYFKSSVLLAFLISATMITIPILEFLVLSLWHDPLYSLVLAREGCEATKALALKAVAFASTSEAASSSSAVTEQAQFQLERGPFMGVCRDAGAAFGGILALVVIMTFKNGFGVEEETAKNQPVSTASSSRLPLRIIILRLVIGFLSCSLFYSLQSFLLSHNPFTSFLSLSSTSHIPALFVYARNYFIFGTSMMMFLVAAPALMIQAERKLGWTSTATTGVRKSNEEDQESIALISSPRRFG